MLFWLQWHWTKWGLPHLRAKLSHWDRVGDSRVKAFMWVDTRVVSHNSSYIFCGAALVSAPCTCWQWGESMLLSDTCETGVNLPNSPQKGWVRQLFIKPPSVSYLLDVSVIWACHCDSTHAWLFIFLSASGNVQGGGGLWSNSFYVCVRQKGLWCVSKTSLLRKPTSGSGCVPESTPAELKVSSPHIFVPSFFSLK